VHRCLLRQIEYAVDAAIDAVQIRERDLPARDLASLVVEAITITRGTGTRLIVNDRLDVALACGADGVHLRADSVAPAEARAVAPAGFIIGRSVHSASEVARLGAGADYLIAGTIWATPSKPLWPHIGVNGLGGIVRVARIPVLAIGGVDAVRVRELKAAGAAGAAAIGIFMRTGGAGAGEDNCRAIPLSELALALRAGFDTSETGL
jgi:thiamine-phosphate pyrophosphorylase